MVKLLTPNINYTIAQYIIEPIKTLKKWIKPFVKIDELNNYEYVYCRFPDKINWFNLPKNNTLITKVILGNKIDEHLFTLSVNSSRWAYKKQKEHANKIIWSWLSLNTNKWAYKTLRKRPHIIDWSYLSLNSSNWAYKMLKNNLNKINWLYLSENPNNLIQNIFKIVSEKIDWSYLSANSSKWAYNLLKKNLDKINFAKLSENPSKWAYKLLKNNQNKIDWNSFSSSPHLYKIVKTDKYYKMFDRLVHKLFK